MPVPTKETIPFASVHTPVFAGDAENVTGRPELAVAESV